LRNSQLSGRFRDSTSPKFDSNHTTHQARELAARRHPDRHLAQRELKALHVNPEDFQHGFRYRVDLEAGKLVSASEFASGRNSD
jgi:hypothetical protein